MGIFILEKGASPYWDGGQDAPDCRSGSGHYAVGATTIAVHPRRGRKGRAFDARTISPVASHPCSRAAAVSKAGRVTSAKSNRLAMSGGEGVRYFSSRRHAMPSHACQPSRIAGDILKSA